MKPGFSEMTTLLIAEHDHETLKDVTNKALTAASQLGGDASESGSRALDGARPSSVPSSLVTSANGYGEREIDARTSATRSVGRHRATSSRITRPAIGASARSPSTGSALASQSTFPGT